MIGDVLTRGDLPPPKIHSPRVAWPSRWSLFPKRRVAQSRLDGYWMEALRLGPAAHCKEPRVGCDSMLLED